MAKNNVTDVEYEEVGDIQKEVEAETKATKKAHEKFFTKDRIKRWGKETLKVSCGVVVGIACTIAYGMSLANKNSEHEPVDEYYDHNEEENPEYVEGE